MRIAVISDTHIHDPSTRLESVYAEHLASADAVLHCGDMTGRSAWSFLCQHPNFHAVAGNMDDWALVRELPPRLTLRLDDLTVGLAHGDGLAGRPLSRAVAESFGPGYDLVCFGHTHTPEHATYGETHVVNPGALASHESSPTLAIIHTAPFHVEFVRVKA
ncbi:MAG: YfcE family phosphodiesterase [Thermodesulfobacteriota bacterium]